MAVSHPAGELIEDREVERFDDDRLGHKDIVDQLARLVQAVPTPSNIALYGAWGSGKSGIGKMLQTRLPAGKKIQYARFDAFKYAQNPLRRNFVSVVATALGQKAGKYHSDLYGGSVSTEFKIPMNKVIRLFVIFACVVFVYLAIVLSVTAFLAWTQEKDVWAEFARLFSSALPASLVPATLMTAVIALGGKTFVREKRVERADSDEEFERLLRDLVADSGADRVVIFVDEIDRCAPADVVETLNAIRTFLGVGKCIFLIAADPQVIEQALAEGSAQANPTDELNPYYSAGSAYLDKVFQYQVTIPPLMSQSVTSFAVELVADRPGLWQRIDTAVVASILIPTHVRSPRRVKNLLNSFALAYRLAEARVESGLLDVDIITEIDELARIVCLRVEFPLFARDLVSDPLLSEYVLQLSEVEDSETARADVWSNYPYVNDQTKRIAQDYAGKKRHVDRLLIESDIDAGSADNAVTQVAATHGQQLLDYLSRTRLVSGPTKALIHLQNSGPLFGLPSNIAEQLERDSQNGTLQSVRNVYNDLDENAKSAAIDLLVQQARTSLGYESQNIARAILAAITFDGVPSNRADTTAMLIGQLVAERPQILWSETAVGAWRLSLSCSRTEATELGQAVLRHELAETDDTLFAEILAEGYFAAGLNGSRLCEIVLVRLLVENPSPVVDLLNSIGSQALTAVLSVLDAPLVSSLQSSIDEYSAWTAGESARQEEEAAAAALAARRGTVVAPTEPQNAPFDCTSLLESLAELTTNLAEADKPNAERVASMLAEVRRKPSRDLLENQLINLMPVESADLTHAVLREVQARHHRLWPEWLSPLRADRLQARSVKQIVSLVDVLRDKAQEADSSLESDVRAAAESIERLLGQLSEADALSVQKRAALVGNAIHEQADIAAHQRSVDVAMLFASSGLCTVEQVLIAENVGLSNLLEEVRAVEAPASELAEYVLDGIRTQLTHRHPSGGMAAGVESQKRLIEALAKCEWLSEFDSAHAVAVAYSATAAVSDVPTLKLATASTVASYKADMTKTSYTSLCVHWLAATEEELSAIYPVIEPLLRPRIVSAGLLNSLALWRNRAGALQRSGLLHALLQDTTSSLPNEDVLHCVGLSELPDDQVADFLIERYSAVTTNPRRIEVLRLWAYAQISQKNTRERLIRDVLIPILGQGVTAVEPALVFLPQLGSPVPGVVRKALGDAVVKGTEGKPALERRGQDALGKLGYRVETTGFFRQSRKVNTN